MPFDVFVFSSRLKRFRALVGFIFDISVLLWAGFVLFVVFRLFKAFAGAPGSSSCKMSSFLGLHCPNRTISHGQTPFSAQIFFLLVGSLSGLLDQRPSRIARAVSSYREQ